MTSILTLSLLLVPGAPVDFQRDVRPILADNCFQCHGPDDAARKAKLRLDQRDAALKGGRSEEPAIVPGKPELSDLVRRILSDDPQRHMPPAKSGKTLTTRQIDTLKRWVAEGAEYRAHWAFIPPKRVPLPAVQAKWGHNDIDRFILARLEAEGLQPSPPADAITLIRRLHLDLVGIPPTPEEADAFVAAVAKDRPAAIEAAVDRLLASPHYGERWARRWLDLARYADTNGYEKDRQRSIWPYRDWLIDALNRDLPFDQFTIEQLAGDLLPNPTPEQHIATGFHRNTMLNEEGGIDPLEFRFHAMTDRIATTGTTWLGLTVGCAQCHSHKYDPISHREYYGLFAFLNNTDEPEFAVKKEPLSAKRREIEMKITGLEADLAKKFPAAVNADEAFAAWLATQKKQATSWQIRTPAEAKADVPLLTVQANGSVVASGDMSKRDVYRLILRGELTGTTAIRLEALPDENLPRGGPGRVYYEGPHGEFHLSEIVASVQGQPIKFAKATQTFAGGKFTASMALDGDPQTGWGINGGQGKAHVAVFVFEKPIAASQELKLELIFERYYAAGLGKFRISTTTAANAEARDIPVDVEANLLLPDDKWTDAQRAGVRRFFHATTTHLAMARQEIDALRKSLPAYPTTLILRERPKENPRPTFLHHRGEFLQPKDRIGPTTPAVLPPLPEGAPRDRLHFARWLVSRDNPLTARVTVNRQWAAIFGRGLVKTTEDFGLQGELPSHPELLDWLALNLIDNSWSLKKLHKTIVLSATYQQSSRLPPGLYEKDPDNRLLARGPRVRLEAELIRDSVLRASGLLSAKIGGPSVYPPQPASVTTEGTYGALPWTASTGEDRYRRGLYTFAKRTAPFAMFSTFDSPSGEACIARRDVSNTPLQALTLLNDVVFTEAAQASAKLVVARPEKTEQRVTWLFRRYLLRAPNEAETKSLVAFITTQQERLLTRPEEAKKLAGPGDGDPVERAAWTALARVLMNLDEFVMRN